MILDTPNNAKY